MTRKLKRGQFVHLLWQDAASRTGWREDSELDRIRHCALVETAGFVVRNDTRGLYVTPSRHPDDPMPNDYLCVEYIPWGMVKKLRLIRRRKFVL